MSVTFLLGLALIALTFDVRFGAGARGVISISVFECVSVFTLFWCALNVVYQGPAGRTEAWHRIAARFRGPLGYVGLALAFSFAGWFAGSPDGLHGMRDLVGGVCLGVALTCSVERSEQLEWIGWALAAAVGAVSMLALSQYFFGGPYLRELDANAYFKHALGGVALVEHPVVGSMTHPNSFAVFVGPLTALCAGSAKCLEGPRPLRMALFGAAAMGVLALVGSNAKMAAVIFIAMTAWCLLRPRDVAYRYRSGLRWLAVVCVGLIAVAVGLVSFATWTPEWAAPGTLLERAYLDIKALETLGSSVRVFVLGGAIEEFRDFTTVGLGVHNEYLHQALRYGAPVALAFVALLIEALRLDRAVGWGFAPVVIGLAAIFLVEPAAGAQLQGMLFFVLAYSQTFSSLARQNP